MIRAYLVSDPAHDRLGVVGVWIPAAMGKA
jgi:hypothetical protein